MMTAAASKYRSMPPVTSWATREPVGGQRAHGDEGVHVGGAPAGPAGGLAQERPADPELHRRGQHERGQPAPGLLHRPAGPHGQGDQRRRQRDGHHQPPTPCGLGLRLGIRRLTGPDWFDAIADAFHRSLQAAHVDGAVGGDLGLAGREVHLGAGHARLPTEHALDPDGTGAAGHALHREVQPAGVPGAAGSRVVSVMCASHLSFRPVGGLPGGNLVSLLLDRLDQVAMVDRRAVVDHRHRPGGDVHGGAFDAVDGRQGPLDGRFAVVTVDLGNRDGLVAITQRPFQEQSRSEAAGRLPSPSVAFLQKADSSRAPTPRSIPYRGIWKRYRTSASSASHYDVLSSVVGGGP